MLAQIGNKNFALLGKMMDLTSARQRVIAQNISNVNTPNYRRREFKFETALSEAMRGGTTSDYKQVVGYVDRPNVTPVRNNGNNVDIDLEMMMMKQNASQYEIFTSIYSKKSQMVKMAIRG